MDKSHDINISQLLSSIVPRQQLEGLEETYISQLPTFCPRCRESALGAVCGKASWQPDELGEPPDAIIEVPIKCACCDQLYVACYISYEIDGEWTNPDFVSTVPSTIMPTLPSKTIMKIAPLFSKIYGETAAAELAGLSELLGAGYRRALEVLVKQYLIFRKPENREIYEQSALRNCIKQHIDDEIIKNLADKAAILGNDFTHYKKYGINDIKELKDLIELTRRWIELHHETALVLGLKEPPET